MNKYLLDILICPVAKEPLLYHKKTQELICKASRLAYPIQDGIPMMLPEKARKISLEELDQLK